MTSRSEVPKEMREERKEKKSEKREERKEKLTPDAEKGYSICEKSEIP